jgi:hypothetical protein
MKSSKSNPRGFPLTPVLRDTCTKNSSIIYKVRLAPIGEV